MSNYLKCGARKKFYVASYKDVDKYLDASERQGLEQILCFIRKRRMADNKNINEYIVINTDEPYFWIIKLVMKLFRHWG